MSQRFRTAQGPPETHSAYPYPHTGPDVGTAWLLLSHAGWLAVSLACVTLGLSLLIFFEDSSPFRPRMKPLAIGWTSVGLAFAVWTAYAVGTTWRSNRQVPNAVFGDFGFSFVMILTLGVLGVGIWSLVDIAAL